MGTRKIGATGLAAFCAIVLSIAFLQVPTECYGLEIAIDVSPNTLNIQNQGEVVTVHTNILYGQVDGGTVTLNDVAIDWWKADNRGNFVAKFLMSEVKALAEEYLTVPGENTLTLEGFTNEGEAFTGTQVITIINVEPVGTGRK